MRVALISDIHANKVALEAVLRDMPDVDAVVCAGDVVGYNPWPVECVDAVRGDLESLDVGAAGVPDAFVDGVPTVIGNHDRMVASDRNFRGNAMAAAGVSYARSQLDAARIEWLRALPTERRACDRRVKVVHGHPDDPDRYTYPREFGPHLLGDEDLLVLGHTHVQGYDRSDAGVVCNPGSVGQPRDGDPRAAYAVVDLDDLRVEERRVDYDVEAVQAAVEAANLPPRTGERLAKGR